MSWDADLYQEFGEPLGEWNYTHNCNGMANEVVHADYEQTDVFSEVFKPQSASWWKMLDGMDGIESAALLGKIIKGLDAAPEHFRAMNPDNGWGDYDSFLEVLKEMRAAIPEAPVKWSVRG